MMRLTATDLRLLIVRFKMDTVRESYSWPLLRRQSVRVPHGGELLPQHAVGCRIRDARFLRRESSLRFPHECALPVRPHTLPSVNASAFCLFYIYTRLLFSSPPCPFFSAQTRGFLSLTPTGF